MAQQSSPGKESEKYVISFETLHDETHWPGCYCESKIDCLLILMAMAKRNPLGSPSVKPPGRIYAAVWGTSHYMGISIFLYLIHILKGIRNWKVGTLSEKNQN